MLTESLEVVLQNSTVSVNGVEELAGTKRATEALPSDGNNFYL